MISEISPSKEIIQATIDRFWETFPPVWNRIRLRVHSVATQNFDISVEQFHILRHVRKGVDSVSDLATEKRISRSAISQAVDILVHKGLLTRHPNADDRRCVRLELTESGSALLSAIFENNRAWMAQKLAALSQEQLLGLVQALDIFRQTFDERV